MQKRMDVKATGFLILNLVFLNKKIKVQIKKYTHRFLNFLNNNIKAQLYVPHGLESMVAMHQAQMISRIPHIWKEMYDEDVLEKWVIGKGL